MKKKHIFYLISGGLVFLGIILYITGFALGGRLLSIGMNRQGFVVETLDHTYSNNGVENMANQNATVEESFTLDAFQAIDLKANFCNINVERSDHYGISYKIPARYNLEYESQNGNLTVRLTTSGSNGIHMNFYFFGGFSGDDYGTNITPSITLLVPEDAEFTTVNMNAESGQISISDLKTNDLIIKNTFGSIDLSSLEADGAAFDMESGKLYMNDAKLKNLKLINTFGNVTLNQVAVAETGALNSESCTLDFTDTSFQTLEVQNTFGNVNASGLTADSILLRLESVDTNLDDLTANHLDLKTSFGKINVSLLAPITDYGYDVKTEFGSIDIDGTDYGTQYKTPDTALGKNILIKGESSDVTIRSNKL